MLYKKKKRAISPVIAVILLVGLAVAAVFALLDEQPLDWVPVVLALAAIFAGIFYADHSDASGSVIRWLGLFTTLETGFLYNFIKFGEDAYLGEYIYKILAASAEFLAPYVLTIVVMGFVKKHLLK